MFCGLGVQVTGEPLFALCRHAAEATKALGVSAFVAGPLFDAQPQGAYLYLTHQDDDIGRVLEDSISSISLKSRGHFIWIPTSRIIDRVEFFERDETDGQEAVEV